MTIHNLEISTAHFTNNDRTEIEVTFIAEESTKDNLVMIPYYIEAKKGDLDYEWLLTKMSLEDLHEKTVNRIRSQRSDFEDSIKFIADREGLTIKSLTQDSIYDTIIDTISNDIDDESLFKFKLKIFDIKSVKSCKDRSVKAEIRKAKTISEVIAAFSKI